VKNINSTAGLGIDAIICSLCFPQGVSFVSLTKQYYTVPTVLNESDPKKYIRSEAICGEPEPAISSGATAATDYRFLSDRLVGKM
jgi:hypothetical protein